MATDPRVLIEKTAEYTAKIGSTFIETLKQRYPHEPGYSFLYDGDPNHARFLERIEYFKASQSQLQQQQEHNSIIC